MITIEIRGEKEVIDALRDFKAESDLAIMEAFKKVGLLIHRCYKTLTGDHYISFAQDNYFKYRFPDYQFSPRRFKVTLDNIDRFNVFVKYRG